MFFPVRPNWPCHTRLMMHPRSPMIHEQLCRIPAQYQQTIDQDENGTGRFFTQFKIVVQFLSVKNSIEHQQFVYKTLLNGFKNCTLIQKKKTNHVTRLRLGYVEVRANRTRLPSSLSVEQHLFSNQVPSHGGSSGNTLQTTLVSFVHHFQELRFFSFENFWKTI